MKTDNQLRCITRSTEYLIRRPWLTARRDEIEYPDGRVQPEYYVLEYPDWINIIAITDEGQIILERQWRQALGVVSLEIPAGVVEEGETPLEAAQRELAEETGYTGGSWTELLTIAPNPGVMNNTCHCFVARGVSHTTSQHLDATEDLDVMLCDEADVFAKLQSGAFLQAMMVAPLWKYFYQKQDR